MKTAAFLELNSSYSHSMLSNLLLQARALVWRPQWRWTTVAGTGKTPSAELCEALARQKPDLVLASGYIFNIGPLLEVLTAFARRHPAVPLVLGGPNFLGDNAAFLRRWPMIRLVVRGDEAALLPVLDWAAGERRLDEVPGGCYLDGDGNYIDRGTAELPGSLDEIPSPYQLGLVPPDKVFYQLETARGCGSNCTFCTSARETTRRVRFYSLERVRADLTALRERTAIREIRLLDRTFNQPSERAAALLQMFRAEFADFRFHLEIDPGRLTPEVLWELAAAPPGQLHVEAGIQSLTPAVLQAVRRSATAERMFAGLERLIACGNFAVHADLLAGLPQQDAAGLRQDLQRLIAAGPAEIQLESLKILPGSALGRRCPDGMRFDRQPPWSVTETPWLSAADLRDMQLLSRLIDGFYNRRELRNLVRGWQRLHRQSLERFFAWLLPHYRNYTAGQLPLERRLALLLEFPGLPEEIGALTRLTALLSNQVLPDLPAPEKTPPEYENWPLLHRLPQRGRQPARIVRIFRLECCCNALPLWLDGSARLEHGRFRYAVGCAYGRVAAEVRGITG